MALTCGYDTQRSSSSAVVSHAPVPPMCPETLAATVEDMPNGMLGRCADCGLVELVPTGERTSDGQSWWECAVCGDWVPVAPS